MPLVIFVNRFGPLAQPLVIFGEVNVFDHRRRINRDFQRVGAMAGYELTHTFGLVFIELHDVFEIFRGDDDRMSAFAAVGRQYDAFFALVESVNQTVDDLFGDHRLIDQRDERRVLIRAEYSKGGFDRTEHAALIIRVNTASDAGPR